MVKIDRLGDELSRSMLGGTAATLIISIRSYHHHRQIGATLLDFREQLQTVHTGHVDVRQNGQQFWFDFTRKRARAS